MEGLKKILNELIDLNNEEWELFIGVLKKESYISKEAVVKEGAIASKIYFIKSGLLRSYYLEDGKEITTYFACDNQFIGTFSSFITQTPSNEILEAIEDCVVYSLSYNDLNKLYRNYPKFEKLGRIWAEKNYLCILDRTTTMQTKTGKQKYLDFIKSYDKKIVQFAPQHQIASFLGVAPESLSRIRKDIVTS